MTAQTTFPGWGYMKAKGATSIWEAWEGEALRGHSLLHSSYLYPGAWYIDGVAGIRRDPDHPGFGRFIIRPPRLPLTWARATFQAPTGLIRTAWQHSGDKLRLEVTVPPGTRAKVYFPGKDVSVSSEARAIGKEGGYAVYDVPAGRYVFTGAYQGLPSPS